MIPLDRREQLHSTALQPEHADSVADLGPFGIEIVGDKVIGQRAYIETRRFDMLPIDAALEGERDCAGEQHRLSREEADVLGRHVAVDRLVEQATVDRNGAVAADYPILAAADAERFGGGELRCNLNRIAEPRLQYILVDVRSDRLMQDASGVEHLPSDRTGRGKDQGQKNNLVEKDRTAASPRLGTVSTAHFQTSPVGRSDDPSTGTESAPSL